MKYENIDLIDALRRISDIHTEHYKEDFELDQKLIRDLAATHSAEDKHLLWMSRPHGTHIMREREVYIEDTYENKTWEFYREQTSDPILAYSVEITGVEDGTVVGNLIELDYTAHVERMKQLTVDIEKVAVTFEDQNTYYLPLQSCRLTLKTPTTRSKKPIPMPLWALRKTGTSRYTVRMQREQLPFSVQSCS